MTSRHQESRGALSTYVGRSRRRCAFTCDIAPSLRPKGSVAAHSERVQHPRTPGAGNAGKPDSHPTPAPDTDADRQDYDQGRYRQTLAHRLARRHAHRDYDDELRSQPNRDSVSQRLSASLHARSKKVRVLHACAFTSTSTCIGFRQAEGFLWPASERAHLGVRDACNGRGPATNWRRTPCFCSTMRKRASCERRTILFEFVRRKRLGSCLRTSFARMRRPKPSRPTFGLRT